MISREQIRALKHLGVKIDLDLDHIEDVVLFPEGFRIERGSLMVKRSFSDREWMFCFGPRSRPFSDFWVEIEVFDLNWIDHPELLEFLISVRKLVLKEFSIRESLEKALPWLKSHRDQVDLYVGDYYWQTLNQDYTFKVGDSPIINGAPHKIERIQNGCYYFTNHGYFPIKYVDILNAGEGTYILNGKSFRRMHLSDPNLLAKAKNSEGSLKSCGTFNDWVMIQDKKFVKQKGFVI